MKVGRVHITGASGAGTTTLGRALATRLGWQHVDADDLFWESDSTYTRPRPRQVRTTLLRRATDGERWVLSGSITGWGDELADRFDRVVLLTAPTDLRIKRLTERERQRYGAAVMPGGAMYEAHRAFLDWAARYDTGDKGMRSRALHEQWVMRFGSKVLRLDGSRSLDALVAELATAIDPAGSRVT